MKIARDDESSFFSPASMIGNFRKPAGAITMIPCMFAAVLLIAVAMACPQDRLSPREMLAN